ncbi:preprotein translocase subunit YajC [Agromyces aerolatus]|uniref:preprotein translocase subunit YajC n=1 Tax=Agromyces sp. LY-1074 TaxID=3074080 RepID=UPI0028629004|nr:MULTISPECIES: preprotein translocase subunit YajC [unclassified Agromyces]MDR5700605.1 preprotein translocase subunit YajC [Agromyces sp. LY-1074]MDR5707126.1 preprotein translocase subunit YajC [Agromyces sp. LY-1358]
MLAILAVLIFFMFRNSRKRQADARELQSKVVPGATVMTNFGMFGTIQSIDEEDNKVELEIAPGTVVTVHRQVVARVVDEAESTEATPVVPDTVPEELTAEPEYGQRLDDSSADEQTDPKKKSDD